MTNRKNHKNPWTVVSTKIAYSNRWITVEHCDVLDPSNRKGIYGIVRYARATVATLAVDDQGRICLVGQYRLPHRAYAWELPGGGAAHGGNMLEAARRELLEETGWEAANWFALLSLHPSNGTTDEVAYPFLAWTLRKQEPRPETTELLCVHWVPFWTAVARVEAGEILDATSIVALLRVALMSIKGELPEAVARTLGQQPTASPSRTGAR